MAFADLLARLDSRPGVRGRQFERICAWYLRSAPEYRAGHQTGLARVHAAIFKREQRRRGGRPGERRLRVVRDSVDGRCLGGEGADALMGELGHGVVSGDTVDGAMKDQLLGVTLWSAINTA
jgi:hypothetical protein